MTHSAAASSPIQSPCNIMHHSPSWLPVPFLTTPLHHHFPSPPLPFLTTSLRHHSTSSSLPFFTTSLRHHFPSSHFPASPLPFLTTPLHHHFPSSPLPFLPTSHRHHFPSSPLPFVTTSLPHHFPPMDCRTKGSSIQSGLPDRWPLLNLDDAGQLPQLRALWILDREVSGVLNLKKGQVACELPQEEVHLPAALATDQASGCSWGSHWKGSKVYSPVPWSKTTVWTSSRPWRLQLEHVDPSGLVVDHAQHQMVEAGWVHIVVPWSWTWKIRWRTQRCQSLVVASRRLKPMSGKCWSPPHRSAQHASKNVVAVDASQSKASSSSGCAIGMLLAWSSCYHPFRWLNSQPKGETSTNLSVFTGFTHQKTICPTSLKSAKNPAWNVSSGGWILIIYPDVSHEISTKNISPEISPEDGWIVFLES